MMYDIFYLLFYGWLTYLVFNHIVAYNMAYKMCNDFHRTMKVYGEPAIEFFDRQVWDNRVKTINTLQSGVLVVGLPLIVLCGGVWGYIMFTTLTNAEAVISLGLYMSAVCLLVICIMYMGYVLNTVRNKLVPFFVQLAIVGELIKTEAALRKHTQITNS